MYEANMILRHCSLSTIVFILGLLAINLPALKAANTVTYEGIGTYFTDDFYDLTNRPINVLPQEPEKIDPIFILYTRKNWHEHQRLPFNDTDILEASYYNAALPTKVIVHGFIDSKELAPWMTDMKNRFLEQNDVNVIIVDWSKGNLPPYTQATANTRVVGPMIAIQIQAISSLFGNSFSTFHLVGHSLGAHIVGYAGKYLNGAIGQITGLDPAGPYFEGMPAEIRLWHTDAQFVDAIHTDARSLIEVGFGMDETCGHVDIYPNGGRDHPGCNQERITSVVLEGMTEGARRMVACNHQRSIDFYIASMKYAQVVPKAYQCDSYEDFRDGKCIDCGEKGERCVILGPKTIEHKDIVQNVGEGGKRFYLITADADPYFAHQYVINIIMADSGEDNYDQSGIIQLTFTDTFNTSVDFSLATRTYELGQTYTEVVALKIDPIHLQSITVQWSYGVILDTIVTSNIFVNQIKVIGLTSSTSTTTSSSIVKHFCNVNQDKGYAITNSEKVLFIAC